MTRAFTQSELDRGASVPVFAETGAVNMTADRAVDVLKCLYHQAKEPEKSALAIAIGAIHTLPPRQPDYQEFHRLGDGGWALLQSVSGGRDCAMDMRLGVSEPPCKNAPNQPSVRQDGGCLRCDADCGEACRDTAKAA